jgi:hypothetical protein
MKKPDPKPVDPTAKRLLTDPKFKYYPSFATDIRRTFAQHNQKKVKR